MKADICGGDTISSHWVLGLTSVFFWAVARKRYWVLVSVWSEREDIIRFVIRERVSKAYVQVCVMVYMISGGVYELQNYWRSSRARKLSAHCYHPWRALWAIDRAEAERWEVLSHLKRWAVSVNVWSNSSGPCRSYFIRIKSIAHTFKFWTECAKREMRTL